MANQEYNIQKANPPYRPEPNEKIIDNWGNLETPYDESSEQAVCGAVLIGGKETFEQVRAVMEERDIFILRLRYVWEAFETVVGQGRDIDNLTVEAALKESGHLKEIGGGAYLTQLAIATQTHLHAVSYAYTVRLYGVRRRGMALADTIKSGCVDARVAIYVSIAQMAFDFNKWMSELPNTTTVASDQVANELLFDLDNPLKLKPAIMSGLKAYDDLLGGFTPGNVYLFAADTGTGKSSLVQNIAENNPTKRIAYFSTEMPSKAIMGRMLKLKTGITQRMIRENILSPQQKQLAAQTLKELAQRSLYIDYDEKVQLTPERLKARALQIKGAHGMDLLIVDHVTDMGPAAGFEKAQLEERQGSIALELKLLAGALNVPILAVVQLNREVRSAKESRPNRSFIRGSGRWEQLAAAITLLYREEVYNPATEFPNTAELILDKVRDDGETGTVRVYTDGKRNRYMNGVTRSIDLSKIDDIPPAPKHNVEF